MGARVFEALGSCRSALGSAQNDLGSARLAHVAQPQPVSTDEVMSALELSRGGAHNALQSLVDWKLAHGFKPLGQGSALPAGR